MRYWMARITVETQNVDISTGACNNNMTLPV